MILLLIHIFTMLVVWRRYFSNKADKLYPLSIYIHWKWYAANDLGI